MEFTYLSRVLRPVTWSFRTWLIDQNDHLLRSNLVSRPHAFWVRSNRTRDELSTHQKGRGLRKRDCLQLYMSLCSEFAFIAAVFFARDFTSHLAASRISHSTQPVSRSHLAELNFFSILFTFSFVAFSIHVIFLFHSFFFTTMLFLVY